MGVRDSWVLCIVVVPYILIKICGVDAANLTKSMKNSLQEESREKYGLTEEQLLAVDKEMEAIFETKAKQNEEMKHHRDILADLKMMAIAPIHELEALSREEKIQRLKELHEKLTKAQSVYNYHISRQCQHMFQRNHKSSNGGRENRAVNAGVAQVVRKTSSGAKNKKDSASLTTKKRRVSDPIKKKEKRGEDDEEYDVDIARECQVAGAEASISMLTAMGFARRQVIDALEEANGSIEGAVEWLTIHCV